ncbi:MAG: lipase family protein [Clostridiales bacterium]|nr:lipase family protein [Clostridiales bacterium]
MPRFSFFNFNRDAAPDQDASAKDAVEQTEEQAHKAVGVGPITGCDLSELSSLVCPFERDPFYRLRPPFSKEAAELSLELASMTYTLELDPWMEAGWNDFSIQIDDSLQSGIVHNSSASGERMQSLISSLGLLRARVALREVNPVAQIMSAFRQREKSDTIKAVCMMHELEGGQFLLAIGFMGTGKRFYDWISNFRFTTEEGFHKGFHQLCMYFEEGAQSIIFPKTASALELEKLTLGDILSEMKSGSSRFRLWMAGHSQGSAVMQIYTHRLMTDWGVLPQNMVGYGFASPTVATGRLLYDPASYPLYHILNSDDLVPRMGALLHLGMCLNYAATDELRDSVYHLSTLPADIAVRNTLAPYYAHMVDMSSLLLYSTAFLECLAEEKGEESLSSLISKKWAIPAIDRVLMMAGDKAQNWLSRLIVNTQNGHIELMGEPLDEAELSKIKESMRPIVRAVPMRRLLTAVASYGVPPHHIMTNEQKNEGAYAYIVKNGLSTLQPFIWLNPKDGFPTKHFGQMPITSAVYTKPQHTAAPLRRRDSAAPAIGFGRGVRRKSLTASKGKR